MRRERFHIDPLEKCRLWPGSMLQLKHQHGLLTLDDLQEYRNKLLRFWNDREAAPTKGEKELFNACGEVLRAAVHHEWGEEK